MIGYATYSYLTIACIFLMTSSTLCGSYLVAFSCYKQVTIKQRFWKGLKFQGRVNRQPVRQKQVKQLGIDLNDRVISYHHVPCFLIRTFHVLHFIICHLQDWSSFLKSVYRTGLDSIIIIIDLSYIIWDGKLFLYYSRFLSVFFSPFLFFSVK